ncbi:MAG: InlB B-repeat-containing protein [Bacillales bacterium]|nr:InlB B-repeat-containing protein [Bacillales bacterium]
MAFKKIVAFLVFLSLTILLYGCINTIKTITVYFFSEGVFYDNKELSTSHFELPTPEVEGHTFVNWYVDEDYKNVFDHKYFDYLVKETETKSITVYAKYVITDYNITYLLNGGVNHSLNPNNYNMFSDTITLQAPSKVGYAFAGWYTNPSFTTQLEYILTGTTGNLTLYAKWLANQYVLTLVYNDGVTSNTTITVYYDNTYSNLPSPERIGYTFEGWYLTSNLSGEKITNSSVVSITDNTTLYAKWDIINYTITYLNMDGATNNPNNPATFTFNSPIIELFPPIKTGYTFAGWYNNPSLTDTFISIPAQTTSNVAVYAKWVANEYNVTLIYNNELIENTEIVVTFGNLYGELPIPTKSGFTFGGWYKAFDFSGSEVKNSTIVSTAANHTLYALWLNITGVFPSATTIDIGNVDVEWENYSRREDFKTLFNGYFDYQKLKQAGHETINITMTYTIKTTMSGINKEIAYQFKIVNATTGGQYSETPAHWITGSSTTTRVDVFSVPLSAISNNDVYYLEFRCRKDLVTITANKILINNISYSVVIDSGQPL